MQGSKFENFLVVKEKIIAEKEIFMNTLEKIVSQNTNYADSAKKFKNNWIEESGKITQEEQDQEKKLFLVMQERLAKEKQFSQMMEIYEIERRRQEELNQRQYKCYDECLRVESKLRSKEKVSQHIQKSKDIIDYGSQSRKNMYRKGIFEQQMFDF